MYLTHRFKIDPDDTMMNMAALWLRLHDQREFRRIDVEPFSYWLIQKGVRQAYKVTELIKEVDATIVGLEIHDHQVWIQ
jgi:hypothetical protein